MTNLALVGIGNWGKNYVSTINNLKNVRLKYLCSQSSETLNLYKSDIIKTTNYADLFKYQDIDGVIIATPNATHYQIASEFLNKGYNLLIEKPMVENYKQSVILKSIQNSTKAKVIIGHTYLFDPAYITMKKMINSLGKIRYISYDGTNNGPYRSHTSAIWDIGPHAVSLCLDIQQKKPIQVSAWATDTLIQKKDYYDFCFIKLKFSDQTDAYIKISWLFPVKKRELVIVGTKDTIVYDAVADKKIIFYENMINISKQKNKITNNTKISYPKYNSKTPLEIELREFIDAIKYDKKIIHSDLDFGMEVTKIIEAAVKSIKNNGLPINIIN